MTAYYVTLGILAEKHEYFATTMILFYVINDYIIHSTHNVTVSEG